MGKSGRGRRKNQPSSTFDQRISHDEQNARDDFRFFAENFADRIRFVTEHIDRSVFIKNFGWNKDTLQNYRTGRNVPGSTALATIAHVTGCDPAWLLLGTGPGPFPGASPETTVGRAAIDEVHEKLLAMFSATAEFLTAIRPLLSHDQSAALAAAANRLALLAAGAPVPADRPPGTDDPPK